MKMHRLYSISLLLSYLPEAVGRRDAFIFSSTVKPHPSLEDRTEAQVGVNLDVRLIIGGESDQESKMALTGLNLQLSKDKISDKESHLPMPGANGPNPGYSSGVRSLNIIEQPYFVSIEGLKKVELLQGCWEMVWREDGPAGSIVCGFNIPEEVRRNNYGAYLPAGRLYMSIPVLTADGLKEARAQKQKVETKSESLLKEREDELESMKNTNNILKKALHYRNAFAATENYLMTKRKGVVDVPLEDVEPIGDGLFMCKKATIWNKEGSFQQGKHDLLGYATVGKSDPRIE
mmetsp:Transcript_17902/g.24654  ORF Transcript_17902/g.24654 Transcript_17902/m.24654 type:complete len:290 (-) Transcript_17902:256-1125(-)|eukprot:CAMPEP_0185723614 /NCGR_PEP_ID=MMETSP1171-20130828/398_1 /TAXON_ID=374046 /ORGANISM="Helicotheca tamensis, Strain CCMP826" /LENGTH=289 /DNA_ID=CAMNT_0028391349 /DNA_START=76 /DNA_END=945 /DNA_ORIENTATION=-